MKRIGYFIRRRYLVLVALFLILSVPLCIFISQKKILYKAQAQIAFTGNVGSFRPEIEARRIIADDLLTKLSKEFPGVDKTALKEDLQLDFDKEHILAVGFVSPDPKLAREVANAAARLFIGERDNVKKRTRSQRQEKLASAKRKIGKARYALNSTKKKLTRLKDKNAAVDNRVADLQKRLGELESRREEFLKIFTYKHPDVVYLTSRRDSVKAQLEGLPDNSPIYKSLSAQIDEEAIVFSKAESEYESLNSYYKGMPDDWDVKL
ncbi:MAG: hypothetical protein HQ558_01340, partial [Candidatus Omnitrophica bacterium]|nr:hypothetical protein [Candidatus Omnitrophota bacterium]